VAFLDGNAGFELGAQRVERRDGGLARSGSTFRFAYQAKLHHSGEDQFIDR
jgi:hypothetical protein